MVTRAHTADLGSATLDEVRSLLDEAFEGDFGDADWEHALGGVHVLHRENGAIMGHVAVVQRRIVNGELAIRTGYVEALGVRRDRRQLGYGSVLMDEAEDVIRAAYDLGALSDGTGIEGFYERRGWLRWLGPTWALAPGGPLRTEEEDGGVLVLPTPTSPELDVSDAIACDWRPGDVW